MGISAWHMKAAKEAISSALWWATYVSTTGYMSDASWKSMTRSIFSFLISSIVAKDMRSVSVPSTLPGKVRLKFLMSW